MGNDCPGVASESAGKAEGCKGCPNTSYCSQQKQTDPDIQEIQRKLSGIETIVAIMSGKGGVGKSTVTRNVAEAIASRGIRTCILDLDLSGPSIPKLTGTDGISMHEANNIIYPIDVNEFLRTVSVGYLQESYDEAVLFSSSTKTAVLKRLLMSCDYGDIRVLLLDTPPNITDEHLGIANLIKPRHCIVVTTPQQFSLQDVVRQLDFCRKTKINVMGIVENMRRFVCPSCGHGRDILVNTGIESYCISNGITYLGSINIKQEIAMHSDSGTAFKSEIFDKLADIVLSTRMSNTQNH